MKFLFSSGIVIFSVICFSIGIGNLTMSCSNQFYQFRKSAQSKMRHSKNLGEKMLEIPMLIQNALEHSLQMIEVYNKFQSTAVTKGLADRMVKHLLGFDKTISKSEMDLKSSRSLNAMETLYNHIQKEMNQKGQNLWGLHSGVTSWTTHEKSAPRRANGRFESIAVGTNYKTNQESLAFTMSEGGIIL